MGLAKYITLINRASKVTFRKERHDLNFNELAYIRQLVDNMLANNHSRGGYAGKYERYIVKGGKLPKLPR